MAEARIWLAAAHDAAHRNGGWAWVRTDGEVVGQAGGERRTTRARMALAGFAASLKGLPAGTSLSVVAPEPDARLLHQLLKPPASPPEEDLDLRAVLASALAGRSWRLAVGDPKGATPAAFAASWAQLASDKAKAGGAFVAAIPKTNLSKLKGL
jgi:hypothetical protein